MVYKGESQGGHLDSGRGITRKHDRRGPNGQLPCIILDRQTLPRTLPNHVRSASVLFALKIVANMYAKRQLSVAKLSAKRIFSFAKRDFLVANGRMAADFSSPVLHLLLHQPTNTVSRVSNASAPYHKPFLKFLLPPHLSVLRTSHTFLLQTSSSRTTLNGKAIHFLFNLAFIPHAPNLPSLLFSMSKNDYSTVKNVETISYC